MNIFETSLQENFSFRGVDIRCHEYFYGGGGKGVKQSFRLFEIFDCVIGPYRADDLCCYIVEKTAVAERDEMSGFRNPNETSINYL